MNTHLLDVMGEVCPVPLLRLEERVATLSGDWELLVETDFPRTLRTISQWCTRRGHPFEILNMRRGVWRILVKSKPAPAP